MSVRVPVETVAVETAAVETLAVETLDERLPFRAWDPALRAHWDESSSARINRELRFMHGVGLATCLASLVFDAQAGVLDAGLELRLGLVLPAYLVAIALLRRAGGTIRTLAAVVPIALFVGITSYLGNSVEGLFADRYMMASAMLLGFCIVLLPLRTGPTLLLAAAGYGAVAIPLLAEAGLAPASVDILVLTLLCCTVPFAFKLRSDRVKDSNFLLTLKSRRAQEELLATNRRLETLSTIDALTAVLNRRGFEQRFAAAFEAARQAGSMLALLLLDIDHFKRFNDTHGHQAGDRCLTAVGKLLNREFEGPDRFVGRYGGEEFIVALVGEASRDAEAIANRIRARIGSLVLRDDVLRDRDQRDHDQSDLEGRADSITVSVGVRSGNPVSTSREQFVTDADRALYAAKDAGRDRVVVLAEAAGTARTG